MSPVPQGVSNRRQFSNHIWNVWGYSCLRLPGKPSFLLTTHLNMRLHTLTAEPLLCALRGPTAGVYVGLFMCPCGCDCVSLWKGASFCTCHIYRGRIKLNLGIERNLVYLRLIDQKQRSVWQDSLGPGLQFWYKLHFFSFWDFCHDASLTKISFKDNYRPNTCCCSK